MNKKNINAINKSPSFGGVGEASGEASGKSFKILVIQQKMIGDVLTSSLICENLKLNFPDAEIHYVINKFTIPVVKGHPCIDKFVIFEDEYRKSKIKFYKFLKQISKANYTHVFDAYGKLESLLITKFSKAKFKFGFKKSYSKFYYSDSTIISNDKKTEAGSAIENRLALLMLMPNVKVLSNKPKIYLSQNEIRNVLKQFKDIGINSKNCIMVSALGSGHSKTYPLKYLAEVLDYVVSKTNKKLILNYMPSQQKEINELLEYCDSQTVKHIIEGIEMKSLRAFMAVCSQCAAIIGNEGGAINMAKALDVPSFSIFSPWIIKEGWNSFEINYPNTSVHLSDFKKDLFEKNEVKYIKKNVQEFYNQLKPEMVIEKLNGFLKKDEVKLL